MDTANTTYLPTSLLHTTTMALLEYPEDPYEGTNVIVDKYVTIPIMVIGIPGNIVCFLVWTQKDMMHSSGFYLATLAFTDLSFLSLRLIFDMDSAWGISMLDYPFWCQIFPVIYLTSQLMSPLLALGFTVERYISIHYPFKRVFYCTVKRAKMIVAGMGLFTLTCTLPLAYFYEMKHISEDSSTQEIYCNVRDHISSGRIRSVYTIYTSVVDFLYFVIGNCTILVLNILVMTQMRRNSMKRRAQLQEGRVEDIRNATNNSNTRNTAASTAMLLGVSFFQILTTMPVSIMFTLFLYYYPMDYYDTQQEVDIAYGDFYTYHHVLTIVNEYGITPYAFNIIIYLVTGPRFRKTVKRMVPFWSDRR